MLVLLKKQSFPNYLADQYVHFFQNPHTLFPDEPKKSAERYEVDIYSQFETAVLEIIGEGQKEKG